MGNSILEVKSYNPFCCGTSYYEINNNLYDNYGEMKLDKDNKIITNIIIPNCQLKISPEHSSNKNIIQNEENPFAIRINQSKNEKYKIEKNKCLKDSIEIRNNLNNLNNDFKEVGNKKASDKNIALVSPEQTDSTINSQIHKKYGFSNYNNEFLEYLNKLRTTPNLIIEDIEYIIKNNIKIIEEKEYIVSDNSNEVCKLKDKYINIEIIKDFLENQEAVNCLKLNNNLKIKYLEENIELTDYKINSILLFKKREINNEFPRCFFYPIFIKDIKINIIFLLSNDIMREKLFDNKFSEFNITIFNIKNNRFFGILCLA